MITNNTCNGKCSCCGECCGDILHLSKREIKTIKQYIKKHKIQATPRCILYDYDNTCPFRDNEKKICKIYEVRPEICRVFKCDKSPEEVARNREFNNQKKLPRSMRLLFYKDYKAKDWTKRIFGLTIYDEKDNEII